MANKDCSMSLAKKPCPRKKFKCRRCSTMMRNAGLVWNLVIPTYIGGQFMNSETLERFPVATPTERILEYDVYVNYASPSVKERILYYIDCAWTNYGQQVFDTRLYQSDEYYGNVPGGFRPESDWPDWVTEMVPSGGGDLRSATRMYRIDNMYFSEAEYDDDGYVSMPAHYAIYLHVLSSYSKSGSLWNYPTIGWGNYDPNDGFIDLTGPVALTYRCFDFKCLLEKGEYLLFEREIPTESYSERNESGILYNYNNAVLHGEYTFPENLKAYQVDLQRWNPITF